MAQIPTEFLRADLVGLILDVLGYAGRTADMEYLHRSLLARSHIDVNALRQSVTIFERLDLDSDIHLFSSRSLDPNTLLEEYRAFVDSLEETPTIDLRRLAVRLDFDSEALEYLLLCVASADANLTPMVEIVRNKLNLLDENQIVSVWSTIQSEFNSDRIYFMEVDPGIIPQNWLKTTTINDLKDKIANYIVNLKPRLELKMLEAGRHVFPATGTPSLAKLLTLSDSAAANPISQVELDLARSLGRLETYWLQILSQPPIDFYRALGFQDNVSFGGSQDHLGTVFPVPSGQHETELLMLYEVKKIVRTTLALSVYESPVERALTQYKLGIEVMTPENINDFNKKELILQKELCRFLLERGIFAIGTKFGRSEIDLLADLPNNGYVIETKVYKEKKRPTERSLKNNLTQLQSYMDQSPTRRKGILVIYNFSSTLVSAPRQWVGGRFWFLSINLARESASRRSCSLTIEPGEGGNDLIRVFNVEVPT